MLAYPQDENTVFSFPIMAQPKEDGMRCVVVVKDGSVQFFTRNGKLIQMHNHISDEFLKICKGDSWVFDGELLVMKNGVVLDRKTGNGILNLQVIQLSGKKAMPVQDILNSRRELFALGTLLTPQGEV